MPYELIFAQRVTPPDPEEYLNPCCYGGDVVAAQLLPMVRSAYGEPEANQEDWGWFIWFRDGAVRLAIDIVCDDPDTGAFRLHLTSRRRRFLWSDAVVDTPELERLKERVVRAIQAWTGKPVGAQRLDARYMDPG